MFVYFDSEIEISQIYYIYEWINDNMTNKYRSEHNCWRMVSMNEQPVSNNKYWSIMTRIEVMIEMK